MHKFFILIHLLINNNNDNNNNCIKIKDLYIKLVKKKTNIIQNVGIHSDARDVIFHKIRIFIDVLLDYEKYQAPEK